MRKTSTRPLIFGLLVLGCAIAAVIAVVAGAGSGTPVTKASADAAKALPAARAAGRPMVVYMGPRSGPTGPGQVDLATLGGGSAVEHSTLKCNRVYFSGAGRGLCIARSSGFAAGFKAEIFGSDLHVQREIDVPGVPSRARVSADGRYGSATMFVTGHSYSAAGTFSTQTTIINMATGENLGDLESWTVERGGRQVTAVDVNFWGVTFSARNSDEFYATLATGGKTYLVRGSISGRTARVIHENVECPSVSPDGTRIAYKERTGSKDRPWRLTVLDLGTMRETPLAETRSVDDQAEWLDDGHVLYAEIDGIWSVPADGTGRPTRFLAGASSPAVVRWPSRVPAPSAAS